MTPHDAVASFLSAHDIPFTRAGDALTFAIEGEHKKAMPVVLRVRERTLVCEAFFVRRPLDHAAEVYRMALSRNRRGGPVHFAADADGDVYIVGELPLDGLDEDAIDRLLGAMLAAADEVFPHALEIGFESYLERDRAYRASRSDE